MTLYGNRYTILFSSREEVERQLSSNGVEWHTDDQIDDEETVDESIERATGEVKARLNKLFADTDLANSPWVRYRATIITCYYLSIRRGNSSIYESLYYQALDDFERLIGGELYLPELPRTVSNVIMVQNYTSDNRFPFTPIRVDVISSTEVVPGQINVNRVIPFSWF